MKTTRRKFIAATGTFAAVTAVRGADAKPAPQLGPQLPGNEFKGMTGAMSALLTPYDKKGRVNPEAVEKIVAYGLKGGLTGFYVTGSTGESFLLNIEERKQMISYAAEAVKGRAKLIAHVGCLNTDDAVILARHAADCGYDWVSSVTPIYFAQSWDAAYRHYKLISEATDLPFLIYSIGKALSPDRDAKFFDLKNVKGMKYTGVNFWSAQCLKRRIGKETVFFSGEDPMLLGALSFRDVFSGGIGLTYNFMPRVYAEICRLAAANDFAAAAAWQRKSGELVDLYVQHNDMSYAKAAMRYAGVDCGWCRPPFCQLSEAEYAAFALELDALGVVEKGAAA